MSKSAKKKTVQNHKKKDLHPNSRKVKQLARKELHKIKVYQRKVEYSQRNKAKIERFTFFHNCLPDGVHRLGGAEVSHIIEGYFHRFDDELEQVKKKFELHGNTTQHSGRIDAIKMTVDREKQEFESTSFEIPDLFSTDGFKIFKEWDFSEQYLPKIKTRTVSQGALNAL